MYQKYENTSEDCNYPFSNDFFGYCWAYAMEVDGGRALTSCAYCEFYHPKQHGQWVFLKLHGEDVGSLLVDAHMASCLQKDAAAIPVAHIGVEK